MNEKNIESLGSVDDINTLMDQNTITPPTDAESPRGFQFLPVPGRVNAIWYGYPELDHVAIYGGEPGGWTELADWARPDFLPENASELQGLAITDIEPGPKNVKFYFRESNEVVSLVWTV